MTSMEPPAKSSGANRAPPPVDAWPLHRKLDEWFEENKRLAGAGEPSGPTSKAALARALERPRSSVSNWYPPGPNIPGADIAARLEELMSAPTSYLMDPVMPWPPRALLRKELVDQLISTWSAEEMDALAVISANEDARKELMRLARRTARNGADNGR